MTPTPGFWCNPLASATAGGESNVGRSSMSGCKPSGIMAITPPDQFPTAVWDELIRQGKLKKGSRGMHELVKA